jgi:hypothetical protein
MLDKFKRKSLKDKHREQFVASQGEKDTSDGQNKVEKKTKKK